MNAQTARIQTQEVFTYAQQFSKEQSAKRQAKEDAELKDQARMTREKLDQGLKFLQKLVEVKINQAISCGQFEIKFGISRALLTENLECNQYLAFRNLIKSLENDAFKVEAYHTDNNFYLEIAWN